MKKPLLLVVPMIIGLHFSYGQNNVGIGTTSPNANTMLDVQANADKNALQAETAGNGIAIQAIGRGNAAAINVLKPANSSGQGIYIDHQGTSGPVAQFRRTNGLGSGAAIIGYTNSYQAQSPAIYGNNEGTGDAAIVARINNTDNPNSSLYGETNGSGPAVFALQLGTGRGGQFQINNAANSQHALRAYTDGKGRAGYFTINNASNTEAGLYTETNGSGTALYATNTGTGGVANFETANIFNSVPALRVSSNSMSASTMEITATGQGNDAIYAVKSDGFGSAGNFWNTNATNISPALQCVNNSAAGVALGTLNQANGYAIRIFAGGTRLSTANLTSGTSISTRATAYLISGGGPYTLGFTLADGELMYFYNLTASTVTINGLSIPANAGKTYVVLGGVLREM
jgi:hypothetical protein